MQAWATAPGVFPDGTPSWVIALGIVAGVVTTLAPLLLMRRGQKPEESPPPDGTTSDAPRPRTPIGAAEQELSVVERMLAGIEREQERDREETARLRQELNEAQAENTRLAVHVARLEADRESRDRTIARLRQQVEHYQWERTQQRTDSPTWPGTARRRSRES